MATTGNRDNDTPVQSQVQRDKTVAINVGGRQRTCRGWNSRGAGSHQPFDEFPIAIRGAEDK